MTMTASGFVVATFALSSERLKSSLRTSAGAEMRCTPGAHRQRSSPAASSATSIPSPRIRSVLVVDRSAQTSEVSETSEVCTTASPLTSAYWNGRSGHRRPLARRSACSVACWGNEPGSCAGTSSRSPATSGGPAGGWPSSADQSVFGAFDWVEFNASSEGFRNTKDRKGEEHERWRLRIDLQPGSAQV